MSLNLSQAMFLSFDAIGCGEIKREGPPRSGAPVGTWQVLGLSGPSGREAHQTPSHTLVNTTAPPPNQNVRQMRPPASHWALKRPPWVLLGRNLNNTFLYKIAIEASSGKEEEKHFTAKLTLK